MRTHNKPYIEENRKDIPTAPPDLALESTLNGSNYPCLEQIFIVPRVFEPLKFDSNDIEPCHASDVKINNGCLQSDWTSAKS